MSSNEEMTFCIEKSSYGYNMNFIHKASFEHIMMEFQEIEDKIIKLKLQESEGLKNLNSGMLPQTSKSKGPGRKRRIKQQKCELEGIPSQEEQVFTDQNIELSMPVQLSTLKKNSRKRKTKQKSIADRPISTRRTTRASSRMSIMTSSDIILKSSKRAKKLVRTAKKTGKFKMPSTSRKPEDGNSFLFSEENGMASMSKPAASTPLSSDIHGFISPIVHHHSPTHACEKSPNVKNLIQYHEKVIQSSEPEDTSRNESNDLEMETSLITNEVLTVTDDPNELKNDNVVEHITPKLIKNNPINNVRRSLHNELLASDIAEEMNKEAEVKTSLAPIRENSSQELIENAIRNSWDNEEKEKLKKISTCDPVIKLEEYNKQHEEKVRDSVVTSSSVCSSSVCSSSANTIDMNDITDTTVKDEVEGDCELNLAISDSESETEPEVERPIRQTRNSIYNSRRSSVRVISGKTLSANGARNKRTSVRLSQAMKRSIAEANTNVTIKVEAQTDSQNDSESSNNPNSQWEDTEVEAPRPKILKPVIKPKPKIKKSIPKHNAMSCGGVKRSRNVFTSKNASFGGSPPKSKRFNVNTPQRNSTKTFFGTSEKARILPKVNSFINRGNSSRLRTPGVSPSMGRTRPFSPFGRTPSSSNINSFVGSFLTRTTPQKINKEAELEAKKLQLEEKERKDEEIKRKREEERNERVAESKKKRETRAQKANLLREERERKEKERQDQIQSQKDKRHLEAEQIKNQKKMDELAKIQKEKERQVSAEVRRKEEMEEKNRKIREQETERLRKIENRQLQKKLAEEQKALERRQEEERREQRRLEEEEERRIAEEEEIKRVAAEKARKLEEAQKLKIQKAEERKKRLEEKKLLKEKREKEKQEAARQKILEQEKREKEREEQERIERERLEKEEEENLKAKCELKKKKLEEKRLQKERREEEKRIREAERRKLEQQNAKKAEAERKIREQQEREEKESRELERKKQDQEEREKKEAERKKREALLKKKTEQIRQKVETERIAREEEKKKADALRVKPVFNAPAEPSTPLNATYNLETSNYDMTPRGPNRPLAPSTSENYNIDDISCDDSTDDEDQPKKVIPAWAKGHLLHRALLQQYYYSPNINSIFANLLNAVNLSFIFEQSKPRYFKRTSSAHWSSPIMPPGNRSFTSHNSK